MYGLNTLGKFLLPFLYTCCFLAALVDKSNRSSTILENELPFFLELDTTTHEQNIIWSTITVGRLFAGHVLGSWQEREK